jgi:hypothetical protein
VLQVQGDWRGCAHDNARERDIRRPQRNGRRELRRRRWGHRMEQRRVRRVPLRVSRRVAQRAQAVRPVRGARSRRRRRTVRTMPRRVRGRVVSVVHPVARTVVPWMLVRLRGDTCMLVADVRSSVVCCSRIPVSFWGRRAHRETWRCAGRHARRGKKHEKDAADGRAALAQSRENIRAPCHLQNHSGWATLRAR